MRRRRYWRDPVLSFVVSHEAWYHRAVEDREISVQQAHPEGGVYWEFTVAEVVLDHKPVLKVRVFADAFRAFREIPEFFAALREGQTLTDVIDLLRGLGAVDLTDRREGGPRSLMDLKARAERAEAEANALYRAMKDAPCVNPAGEEATGLRCYRCAAVASYEAAHG